MNRREFLKVASGAALLPLVRSLPIQLHQLPGQTRPNLIIILFDALSAQHLSVYGYARRTAPNLERFASRATVYHNHHSAGNFTTPSTASLLTGVYPWTHRAFNLAGLVRPALQRQNLFAALGPEYHRLVFTQNVYADMLLHQCAEAIDQHQPLDSYSLASSLVYPRLAPNDAIYGMKSYDQFLFKREEAHGSLFLSILGDLALQVQTRLQERAWAKTYPAGLPRLANTDVSFAFEQLTDGLMELLDRIHTPTLAYLHLIPPHDPYIPSRKFRGSFADGWKPTPIKAHPLEEGVKQERLDEKRQEYDEFIANLDAEFGRLMDHLERTGLLDNSYIIFTSDHGEMFERGVRGHSTPLLFEPVIRIPLLISAPGQRQRQDIHSPTSNVDLLPTLLHLAGKPIPEWAKGQVLPGFGLNPADPQRSIFMVEAKANPAYQALRKASVGLIKGPLKLVHYRGYRSYKDNYELYDLSQDPGELDNRFDDHPDAKDLVQELEQHQQQAETWLQGDQSPTP